MHEKRGLVSSLYLSFRCGWRLRFGSMLRWKARCIFWAGFPANRNEHNSVLTLCKDKMCRSEWGRWPSSLLLCLRQIRCHLTQDGFQCWHILLPKNDAKMKIELLERTNIHPSSDRAAESRIIIGVRGMRNLLNFAIFPKGQKIVTSTRLYGPQLTSVRCGCDKAQCPG